MRLHDGRYECAHCGVVLAIPLIDDPQVMIRAAGGQPNTRTLSLDGREIHGCEISDEAIAVSQRGTVRRTDVDAVAIMPSRTADTALLRKFLWPSGHTMKLGQQLADLVATRPYSSRELVVVIEFAHDIAHFVERVGDSDELPSCQCQHRSDAFRVVSSHAHTLPDAASRG